MFAGITDGGVNDEYDRHRITQVRTHPKSTEFSYKRSVSYDLLVDLF